jgi:hypothetical protein
MRDLLLDECHDLALDTDLQFIDDRLEVLQNVNIRILIIKFRIPQTDDPRDRWSSDPESIPD